MTGGFLSPLTTSEAERKLIEKELRENGVKVVTESEAGYAVVNFIGLTMEMSSKVAMGRFVVSERSCQPFKVLHGGTTAHIAESIASCAAGYASRQRVAGIELNINHLHAVQVGQEVTVIARPLLKGNRIQVWEVKFEVENPKKSETGSDVDTPETILAAVCRVTLIIGLPIKDSFTLRNTGIGSKL